MNKEKYKYLARQARVGNLGTIAIATSREDYQFFFDEIHGARFPRIGEKIWPRSFDSLRGKLKRNYAGKFYRQN
jgi:hypothetical protein